MFTLPMATALPSMSRPSSSDVQAVLASMVSAIEISRNGKIGPISATSASQLSCPGSQEGDPFRCPFLGAGCFAEGNMQGMHTRTLNALIPMVAAWATAEDVARAEALALDGLTGKRPCRVHVVGDCKTPAAARILSEAAARYTAKHGQVCYTYTHAWRSVMRSDWGGVSVLASTERPSDLPDADARGFGCAMVVDHHEGKGLVDLGNGFKGIPCPEQVGTKESCLACGLCFRADWLRSKKLVILLGAHGQGVKKVKATLGNLND